MRRNDMLVDHWIDIHGHFFTPMTAEALAGLTQALREQCWCLDGLSNWNADEKLAYMDRTGIQMQMLSYVPNDLDALKAANLYGASIVRRHPDRFGLLAALPTSNPEACLAEIARANSELKADGFAVICHYNDVYLSDARLKPVWDELNRRQAVVFAHPYAYRGFMGRPEALLEVAFQTARTFVDMLYAGVFRDYPDIRFVVAHCGGALPGLSGRLLLLGNERWVPNPNQIGRDEMREQLRSLFLDTAATMPTALPAALMMTTPDHIVYGSDCGPPCTTESTMDRNIEALLAFKGLTPAQIQAIGRNALALFPAAAARIEAAAASARISEPI
jgi:6-methylsalicylate decarboxylase